MDQIRAEWWLAERIASVSRVPRIAVLSAVFAGESLGAQRRTRLCALVHKYGLADRPLGRHGKHPETFRAHLLRRFGVGVQESVLQSKQ